MNRFIQLAILPFLLIGCLTAKNGQVSETTNNPEQGPLAVFNANVYPLNKVVCDPFDPGQPGPNDGLIAQLYYRGQGQDRWYKTSDYISFGQKSQKNIFFSSLNVPTRIFSLGFPTETGSSIQNDAGVVLDEYFALSFSSILKLSANDEEGDYQLAILSDDGAMMYVRDTNGQYQEVVSNDGDHPTRLGCGQTITMNYDTELVVKLNYYQGPRQHISLIPMWRKVTSSSLPESRCGQSGNGLFFDSNNHSVPQPAYNELLQRGWKPIDAANWNLPAFAIFNPCTQGTVPTLSQFVVLSSIEGAFSASFQTNIPTTGQLLFKNLSTGEEILTTASNRLLVKHDITILSVTDIGLKLGDTYTVQAIAISADYGKTLSTPLRVTLH